MKEIYKRIIAATVLVLASGAIFFLLPAIFFSLLIILIYLLIVFLELPTLFAHNKQLWLLTPFYPTLSFLLLLSLNHSPFRNLIPFIIIVVSIYDTGAYFVGKHFGENRIAPKVSPKKTWEGFAGGLIIASIATCGLQLIVCNFNSNILMTTVVVLAICCLSTLGDFFESWLKRKAHVKDSSSLLPGHGGLLDRFDSLLFVIPPIWIFKSTLTTLFCLL